MENKLYHAISLLDSYSVANDVVVSGDKTRITGLPDIYKPDMKVKVVTVQVGVAETLQRTYVILAATMVAGTRYELGINFEDEEYEGQRMPNLPIAVEATTLTGTSATDKHNLYYALAYKFNNMTRVKPKAVAYAISTLAQTNTAAFTVGKIVVGSTTGARGINLAGTTGTLTLGAIAGYSSAFNGSEALTELNTDGSASTGTASATTTNTLGIRLEIRDLTEYYPINKNRGGKTIVYAAAGFAASDVTINTAGVYGTLTGARIAAMVPIKEYTTENLVRGYADHSNLNNQPTVGNTYNLLTIEVEETLSPTGISDASNQVGGVRRKYGLYLYQLEADYAATLAAVQALIS